MSKLQIYSNEMKELGEERKCFKTYHNALEEKKGKKKREDPFINLRHENLWL
jgi:hypothetical protein